MVDLLKRKILLIDKRSITGNKHVYFIFKNENFTVDSVVEPLDEMPLKMTSGILFIHVKAMENIEWDELICLKKVLK